MYIFLNITHLFLFIQICRKQKDEIIMSKEENILLNMKKTSDIIYKNERSESYRDIWRTIYGDDYPEDLGNDSFVTMTDLRNIARYLNVTKGDTIVDLGCGRGGPGLWITRETGANYVGIDLSEIGMKVAAQLAKELGLNDKTSFQEGNICATNFPDNCFDGAISIDVMQFLPDKFAGICEVERILRSDSFFAFTAWEWKNSPIPNRVDDYRPLLRKVGLRVEIYNEIPDWERRQREIYQETLKSKKILINDMGLELASVYIMEAKGYLRNLKNMRRILAVAKKI